MRHDAIDIYTVAQELRKTEDLELVGGAFKRIAYLLPFVHAVELERAMLSGNIGEGLTHLWWVLGYGIVVLALAVLCFMRQMKGQ